MKGRNVEVWAQCVVLNRQNNRLKMGSTTKKGSRKKRSNYAGKELNADLAMSMAGPVGKPLGMVFFEDKSADTEPRRLTARRLRLAEEKAAAELAAKGDSVLSKAESKKIAKIIQDGSKKSEKKDKSPYDVWGVDVLPTATKKDLKIKDLKSDPWTKEHTNLPGPKRAAVAYKIKSTPHKVPAVKVAHPGSSYNPSLVDHKAGLQKTVENEMKYQAHKDKFKVIKEQELAKAKEPTPEVDSDEELSSEEDE